MRLPFITQGDQMETKPSSFSRYDESRIEAIAAYAEKHKTAEKKNWTPQSIFARLDSAIIGNKRYKERLALSLFDFMGDAKLRNHLLVTGPSGTGKTYLLEQCLPDFGIPYHIIDAAGLVPAGIKGNTLGESLEAFFQSNMMASRQCLIVLDEFDKLSEQANGGDTQKSHSIQGELLTLIQGKQEGVIDTRNALWIFAGAFAYTDEMKANPPKLKKSDLLKYGFKNELLGRILQDTMTDIPTMKEIVKRVVNDKVIKAFHEDFERQGVKVEFENEAFAELAKAAQNPAFGMRAIPSLVGKLKGHIMFHQDMTKPILITKAMVEKVMNE
jgi:ATP-dependent Clp protease ATP-binding subunit ClpX